MLRKSEITKKWYSFNSLTESEKKILFPNMIEKNKGKYDELISENIINTNNLKSKHKKRAV